MPDDIEVPGATRPWREGDRVVLFFDNDAQLVGECNAAVADELNKHKPSGRLPVVRIGFVPEVFFTEPSLRDIFDILVAAGGELHIEQLEHRWEERQKGRAR